jgi:class 3 adenylate cyclase
MSGRYTPTPINTSHVKLPALVEQVAELLARNAHEVWAEQRLAEQWRWGPARNDTAREHPLLIPYEELPDSEKEYDRRAAQETMKAMIALGFDIVSSARAATATSNTPSAFLPGSGDKLSELLAAWRTLRAGRFPIEHYHTTAERLLKAGEPLVAYDLCQTGLAQLPGDPRLRELTALALARSGATDSARGLLHELLDEGHRTAETLGLLGRTYKDLALRATNTRRLDLLKQSHQHYASGLEAATAMGDVGGMMYTGINAASTAALVGDWSHARALASRVQVICTGRAGVADYWTAATTAESALILGNLVEARAWYERAAGLNKRNFADVSTTRKQARLLLQALDRSTHELDSSFSVPLIGILRTHDRNAPGWALHAYEDSLLTVYAVLKNESDAEAITVLLDRGYEVRVIISHLSGESTDEIKMVLSRAATVMVAHDLINTLTPTIERFAELLQVGLAALHAQALDTELVGLGIESGRVLVDPRPTPTLEADSAHPAHRGVPQEIVAILFADAVNFSRLTDDQLPSYLNDFVGLIARMAEDVGVQPVATNTWGDGFYFVFRTVRDAGRFALSLSDAVRTANWARKGLPPDMNLRVGLHAAPAYAVVDPVTQRPNYVGAHVSRAARIEPITPPGAVYASEAFAALTAATGVSDFACEYTGLRPLAKGYGTFATYHVYGTEHTTRHDPASGRVGSGDRS